MTAQKTEQHYGKEQGSAVARADALLSRWEQRLRHHQENDAAAPGRAQAQGASRPLGARLLRPAALGYVWLAATVAAVATPVQKNWQQALSEAREDQQRQAARLPDNESARQAGKQERHGERTLKKSAGATAEAAGTASDVATA